VQRPAGIPHEPGCYVFSRADGTVVYVGKAANLANRLSNYFVKGATDRKTVGILSEAVHVEWTVTPTEVDALLLENELIKRHQPRYNIRLKDDKSYPYMAISMSHAWPSVYMTREPHRKGNLYFGPFGHAKDARRTLDEVVRIFPVRTCRDSKFTIHTRQGRPCLLADLGKCSAPCVERIDSANYREIVDGLIGFFRGRVEPLRRQLEADMSRAANEQRYEQAARYRDSLQALALASTYQSVVVDESSDIDVWGFARDSSRSVVTHLRILGGRLVGRSSALYLIDHDDVDEDILTRAMGDASARGEFEGRRWASNLTDLRPTTIDFAAAVSPLSSQPYQRVPSRVAELVDMAVKNSKQALARDSLRRQHDHNVRSQALTDLAEALGLQRPPWRVECFDMSHLQGTNYVGSMVVIEDGLPAKAQYRRFHVKEVEGNNDVGAMSEVLRRRLAYVTDEGGSPGFPNPDLIIVDGGLPQLGAAIKVVNDLGLSTRIQLAALAKREELLYRPGSSAATALPRASEALYMVQRLRDEAHRFAITFHRSTRGKSMVSSVLDGIPGMGPKRISRLMEVFGSLDAIRDASLDALEKGGLPRPVAGALYDHLRIEDNDANPEGAE
jgi:excinuclease ABC subunit C